MKIHFFIKVADCLRGLNLDFLLQNIRAINIFFFHHQKPLLASNNRVLIFMLIRKKCFICSQRLVICRLKTCFVGLLKKEKRPGIHRNLNNKGGIFFLYSKIEIAQKEKKMQEVKGHARKTVGGRRVKTEEMKNK